MVDPVGGGDPRGIGRAGRSELRILHLEDEPNDTLLVQAALEAEGLAYSLQHVRSGPEFQGALAGQTFDIILSDFALPAFDGLRALEMARAVTPETPFIFVSGTIGEEAAIAAVRNGATDYVLKHRLSRLAPAVQRAIGEADERVRLRETELALRRSEEHLRQAQKMEAIGRLAAGVAHDFNNLLTVILGYSHLALRRLDADHPVVEDLREIRTAGDRAANLTRQLLAFSRQQVLDPEPVDLNIVISDTEKMLSRVIGADVLLETQLGAGVGPILADRGQLEQVVLNLAVNARDAMPNGGQLTLRTFERELPRGEEEHSGLPAGRYVVMEVEDNGVGMDAELKSRIFEPFFTTKAQGKGTGLGLATVFGIVRQSGGNIHVRSELGRGTTFLLLFPRTDAVKNVTAVCEDAPVRPDAGSTCVLVVDDDAAVRRLARQSLASHGLRVLEACDGHEAMRVLHENRGAVNLLLTDVIMPGMGAGELIHCALDLMPTLKVLCISGYTPENAVGGARLPDDTPFLQKPFTPLALVRKVGEVLDSPHREAA